jgi:chemotaxis-related protein WspD
MTLLKLAVDDCWNKIGIAGDRSCPELAEYVHCHNCPVFEAGARSFFERPAPEGYLEEWARVLDAPVPRVDHRTRQSLLVFRLRGEWLALPAQAVVEVTPPRPVHRIPHRSDEILVGMVNLRGRLQLQVSLHGLLGVDTRDDDAKGDHPRLIVIHGEGSTWVFRAEEVVGVIDGARDGGRLCGLPATLANPAHSFSQAVFDWKGQSVGVLDPTRLFAALREVGR